MFEVRYKTTLVTEQGYNESHFEIISEGGETLYHSINSECFTELAEHLLENCTSWCKSWLEEYDIEFLSDSFVECFNENYYLDGWFSLPDDIVKIHMQEIEVTVNSHLTEASAKAFIKRKQHDYPKLYTYAVSMCYCPQMIELRDWIKGLNTVGGKL